MMDKYLKLQLSNHKKTSLKAGFDSTNVLAPQENRFLYNSD